MMKSNVKTLSFQFRRISHILFFCLIIIGFWLLVIGCFSSYFDNESTPIGGEEINMLSFKMIKTANNNIIGYLEETESILSDKGKEKTTKIYYVYNIDFVRVGFITERGTVSAYQYTKEGTVTQIAKSESYAIDSAAKKLLSYEGAIYYDDFEPAPPWHDRY
ncbi:MAG: hypothetical protein V1709_07485 [Planctomycetota bacterium]